MIIKFEISIYHSKRKIAKHNIFFVENLTCKFLTYWSSNQVFWDLMFMVLTYLELSSNL